MASSLAAQLAQIAATSTQQLNLKAQRAAHSQSLIFDKKDAATQDFDTIYQICYGGFQELCALDSRFLPFERTLFSEQSKTEDRGELTAQQNKELDSVLEDFLCLVGSRLLLSPAVKAVDWLVRRFRAHEYNTTFLLLTFLPYHTTPLFLNLLSIVPEDLTQTFKVLYPYKRSLINPPRQAIVQSAAANKHFFAALNDYVLQAAKADAHYQGLVSFWAGVIAESLSNMLDSAKSGRIDIERKNMEDILIRLLPVLNEAFKLKNAPQLTIGCYMLCVVLGNKGSLQDHVIDGLMEGVAGTWTQASVVAGITCLAVLVHQKDEKTVPRKVIKEIVRLDQAVEIFQGLSGKYPVADLILGLIRGCVKNIGKRQDPACVSLIERLLHCSVLDSSEKTAALEILLKGIRDQQVSTMDGMGKQLSNILIQFNETESLAPLLQDAVRKSGVDVAQLEMSLESVIQVEPAPTAVEDVEMEDASDDTPVEEPFSKAFESIQKLKTKDQSFLAAEDSAVFTQLADVFVIGAGAKENVARFVTLPVLQAAAALEKPLYLSFFVRFFSGPYPAMARAAAIGVVSSCLATEDNKSLDMQAILPFVISSLADASERVRKEATALLAAVDHRLSKCKSQDESQIRSWGRDNLYGKGKSVQWMPARELYKIIHRALVPALEEYALDQDQIGQTVAALIRGSRSQDNSAKSVDTEIKKSVRRDLFTFFCSHVNIMPVYAVKLRLLKILNRVDKVGSTIRTQALLPLFDHWRLLSQEDLSRIEKQEQISVHELEGQVLSIIYPEDKSAVDTLVSCVTSPSKAAHSSFTLSAFDRLKTVWSALEGDYEASIAGKLLEVALAPTSANEKLANSCKELLRAVDLSGPVVHNFVNTLSTSASELGSRGPPAKKRRTSQNNMVLLNDAKEMDLHLQKMTFILEVVDGSNPENYPDLLGGLFQTLTAIHHLKLQTGSEMSYLFGLNLGILLAIVNKLKTSRNRKVNTSTIRADIVIDCVRTSESPQVQNTALLLVAGLATVAPEIVLHSVMPIFTFMGSSVLRKDDEYSALVIDQTIDQVVPPLVQSLRSQKRDVVSGTSELLLSFTAAFEHIPSYRRLRLFEALVKKLGPEDFLYAVFAMFANRYAMDKDVLGVMTALASSVEADLQLITFARYLNLVQDALKPKPTQSKTLLGVGTEDGRDAQKVVVDLLHALSHLLKFASLGSKVDAVFESGDSKAADKVHNLFSSILEQILSLSTAVRSMKAVSKACGETLGTLLNTLSLVDFVDTIEVLLQRPNDDLRRKVLKLLSSRLDTSNDRDQASQTRVLGFLPVLVGVLESSPDILLKHAAVACIEKIAEKYGKKDPVQVVAAAKVVSGANCLGQGDDRIRIMGLLCLASIAEVLGEGIIPALPDALPRALDLLQGSLKGAKKDSQLHDAAYSFVSALLIHVPWMISGDHLDRILQLSFKSACSDLDEGCDENRHEALQLLAKRVDIAETYAAVERNWPSAVAEGSEAANEALGIVRIAVEKHPKSSTIKNVSVLMKVLCHAFDLRRLQLCPPRDDSYDVEEIEEVETKANEVAIKMIYKLNDTIFRPLFVDLTEWASNGLGKKDKEGRLARMTTFFKFLGDFFGTLKSIVTGYSTYIIDSAVDVLKTARCDDTATKPLWLAAMRMLRNSFEHDQDEFWQSPSHLAAISTPLINQLSLATNTATLNLVADEAIPTIVELASSADSPDNHKEMNSAIMRFMRAGSSSIISGTGRGGDSPYTRLAAVKCEQQLTERLGEEWLALLPEMLPYISELMEDDDETVEREAQKWVVAIEEILGERLDDMLT